MSLSIYFLIGRSHFFTVLIDAHTAIHAHPLIILPHELGDRSFIWPLEKIYMRRPLNIILFEKYADQLLEIAPFRFVFVQFVTLFTGHVRQKRPHGFLFDRADLRQLVLVILEL